MSQGGRSAWHVEDTVLPPIQGAERTLGYSDDLGNAPCRCAACTASIGRVAGRLGSWLRRWMDFVVAPYLQHSLLARLVGMNVECTPETTLSGQKMDRWRSRRWECSTWSSWRLEGLVLAGIAQQMLDLTAGSLLVVRP